MKYILRTTAAAVSFLLACQNASAGILLTNDFIGGSGSFKKDVLSVFSPITYKTMLGISGGFYKNSDDYDNGVYYAKLPFIYTGHRNMISLTPFVYSKVSRQNAYGAKAAVKTSLTEPDDKNYVYLQLTGAYSAQKAAENGGDFMSRLPVRQASEEAAFPVEAVVITFSSSSMALATTMALALSLNEALGFLPSSFM